MMETNRSTGGRPRDTFADSHLLPIEDKEGNLIAKTCRYCGHQFSIKTSVTRIKAHLGGVPGQGVAPCNHVPFDVKETAKNAMPSSSSNPKSNANSTRNSDMLQPPAQECGTSCPPLQSTRSAKEQCSRLLDGSPQQSDVNLTYVGVHRPEMEPIIPEVLDSQENMGGFQFIMASVYSEPEPMDTEKLCKDDEAYVGGVPSQGAASCEKVPSTVKEAARNVMPSSSSNPSLDAPLLSPSITDIPRYSDLQQLTLQECCTSNLPPQKMLLGGLSQQTNVDSTCLEVPLNLLDMQTLDDFEFEENYLSHYADLCFTLEPVDTQQCCMNDEINLPHETLTSQEKPSMGSDGLQLLQPVLESLQVNPPVSSELEPHGMNIVPSFAPFDTEVTTPDQTKLEKKRKLLDRAPPSGIKLRVTKLFQGPTFDRKVEEIYASIKDDYISSIGVYGMGGSGKTTVMKHINNLLLEDYSMPFRHVMWVTVSQNHTIPKLQRHLASKLHITLPNDEDQDAWAATLYEKMQDMCYVLILDDVWDEINLEEVGIPEPSTENRCKLILTTRLLDVCNKMNCNQAILLDLFSREEAWELFVKTLNVTPEDSIIQGIMKEVAKECACLPLAIVTVAGSMKRIHDICEWRNALNSLKSRTYGFTDMAKKVIEVLKFSYDRLSEQLQQCLLSFALFPEDHSIFRKELIEMLITEGHIRSDKSLKSKYDEGHTIVNKLENACLLTKPSDDMFVIHDLIRDMCLDIMGGRFLVKCSSKFPPEESEYTEVLEKVSLMNSEFEEIPLNMAPYCPKLSTLLLSKNEDLTRISDSFFRNFPRLKVLNLSGTSIEVLPSSVTNLVSLNALVLRRCRKLRRLPRLTPLKALKQLDLCRSGIEEAPEGLEELVNLIYLDLDETDINNQVSSSTLANLVKLQHLKLPYEAKIMMKDVEELKNLEVFKAGFANSEEFSEYVNSGHAPSEFDIYAELTCLGASCASMVYGIWRDKEEGSIGVVLELREDHSTIGENQLSSEVIAQIPSPEIVQCLKLRGFHQGETRENGELKGIFGATVLFPFSNLVELRVEDLDFIKDLIPASSSVVESGSSPKALPCFQNLQKLSIADCMSLESILVSTANPTEEEEESNNPIIFPNLCRLHLYNLPNLRSICDGILSCPSIESIWVTGCPKLKRLPLQVPPPPAVLDNNNNSGQQLSSPLLPLSSLKKIYGRSKWWESLEWDQPHAKPLLQPYFHEWYWGDITILL